LFLLAQVGDEIALLESFQCQRGFELGVNGPVTAAVAAFVNYSWQGTPDPKDFDLSELNIPRTIQVAVRQRIELLNTAARRVLTFAAVAGRRFDFELLQRVTGFGEFVSTPQVPPPTFRNFAY